MHRALSDLVSLSNTTVALGICPRLQLSERIGVVGIVSKNTSERRHCIE